MNIIVRSAVSPELRTVTAVAASPWFGEGYRKVRARLRLGGVRTSKRRVLRVMREANLLAPTRAGHPHGPKAHDGTITTERPDQVWGIDLTSTMTTREGNASIFIVVDHCTAECLCIHATGHATRFEAVEPVRRAVMAAFGAHDESVGVIVHDDHGRQFVSDHFQRDLAVLGIVSSPPFVREPEGNGYAERLTRTLKEQLLRVQCFATIEELQVALQEFKHHGNPSSLIERHGFISPAAARPALACLQEAA